MVRGMNKGREQTTVDNNAATWPKKWFGFFRPNDNDPEFLPKYSDFIDPGWVSEVTKKKVAGYLEKAECILAGPYADEKCAFCDKRFCGSVTFYSDGEWVWPATLSHDVACHNVRLPDKFMRKIEASGYSPPPTCSTPYDKLPFPGSEKLT